jgi:two-component system, cell cycle sensor histidine kinase and response regulator CckA
MTKKPITAEETLRRYEFIVNTSKDWNTLINRDYVYEAANKAFCMAHSKKLEDIIGMPLARMWGNKTFNDIIKVKLDRCFEGHEVNYQAWFDLPTVGLQCYDTTYYPYRADNRSISHAVVVTRNITRQKMDEESKRKLENELQYTRKIEALATLSGGIAHEFNNALMVVAGNIELLEMSFPGDGAVRKFARAANESIYRMSSLTQQLLAYAREGDFLLKEIDLSEFVKSSLPVINQSFGAGIHLETELKSNLPMVKADKHQLQMTLSAVLKNAVEAMDNRGTISISTDCQAVGDRFVETHPGLDPGSRYVSITVRDQGKGMDEETRSRIFEPFFTTKFQGRGLGMAAAYGIVKNHRGFIYVDSQPGQGTIVRIYLPPVDAKAGRAAEAGLKTDLPVRTVLVIDDEETVLNTIKSLIEKLGYRVLGANSAKTAIELAHSYAGAIDLALLDIKLPDMEGGTLFPLIKQARPDMKVIVCSGYSLDTHVKQILKQGAHGFIQKPFSLKAISDKIKDVLYGHPK